MMIKAMPYRSFLKRAFFVKGMHENKGDHANIGTKKNNMRVLQCQCGQK